MKYVDGGREILSSAGAPTVRDLVKERPRFHCGAVRSPINIMNHKLADAKGAIARMNELTAGYAPPEGACATYCAMLYGLAEFEPTCMSTSIRKTKSCFRRERRWRSRCALQINCVESDTQVRPPLMRGMTWGNDVHPTETSDGTH